MTEINDKTKDNFYNQQREYFDKGIQGHLLYKEKSVYAENIINHITKFVKQPRDARILELGCGCGRFTIPLLKRGFTVYGVDFSQTQLAQLSINAQKCGVDTSRLKLYSGNINELSKVFGNEKFDCVVGFFLLHHLPDLAVLFNEINKILNKDGQIVFIEPNRWCMLYLFQIAFSKDMSWEQEKGTFTLSIKNIKRALSKFGFTEIGFMRFGLFPPQILDRLLFMLKVERFVERLRIFNHFLPFVLINAANK